MANILVVDDDTSYTEMVSIFLTLQEHTVTTFNSGVQGWSHLRSNKFDLVVLDWEMTDLDGIDILKQLRSSGDNTPIIMLTGRSTMDDKEMGFDAGATDYLTKPFHMKELGVRIRAALRNQATAAPRPKALGTNNTELLKKADLTETALAAKYEFLEILGEGGIARVFKARHPHLDKFVAIKMLQSSELSEDMMARFEREARVVSKLDHPNIIGVYDFGLTERKQPYMVMEFIEGKGLDQILQEEDCLELEPALAILLPVCDGIAYAHEQKILHRDLKPSNIMLKQIATQKAVPKVLDFGLAKHMDINVEKSLNLTQTQQIIGTPPYMSPEVVRRQTLDERSDVYSFACVIFEVVTGYQPFIGDSAIEVILKHLEEPPLTFDEVRPGVEYPPALEQLIAKALEIDPNKRHQTMRELQAELAHIVQSCYAR